VDLEVLVEAERLVHRERLRDHGEDGTVARRRVGDVIERDEPAAARHVDRHDRRIARDVAAHVTAEHARVDVVIAARRGTDVDTDLLAAIEVLDRVGGGGGGQGGGSDGKRDDRQKAEQERTTACQRGMRAYSLSSKSISERLASSVTSPRL